MKLLSAILLVIFLIFTISLSGCIRDFNNLTSGDSTIITNQNLQSCDNWQEGRHWEINGENVLDDDWCKGKTGTNTEYYAQVEHWDLNVGDEITYIKAGYTHCQVTVTQNHLDNLEASCY
jgi:hypothetical protein